jgi:hypothetical protein
MRLYVNAGFGERLGVETLRTIGQRGYAGIRQDIPRGEVAEALVQEIAEAGLHPLLLVCGGKMGGAGGGMAPQVSPNTQSRPVRNT